MMEHKWEHTIREQFHKILNIEHSAPIRYNLLDTISTEQKNSPKQEHQNGDNSHAYNNNLHNFSFVNTPETKHSSRDEEQKYPEIELFQPIHIFEYLWHYLTCHYTFGDGCAQ